MIYRQLAALILVAALAFATPASATRAQENPAPPPRAAKILVTKSDRQMYLFDKKGNMIRSYTIALGKDPVGKKEKEGDNRTPEGRYFIDARNDNSDYHLSLRISYPSKQDRQRAKKRGISNPGGDIFIHGKPNKKGWQTWKYGPGKDWTNGCIAVSDEEIQELWQIVPDGTPIMILP